MTEPPPSSEGKSQRGNSEFGVRLEGESAADVEFGLDRIRTALQREQLDDPSFSVVLIGGTNGKGGTAAYLNGILQAHGRRVGLFTSPHLVGVRERWRIDGQPVEAELVREIGIPLIEKYGRNGAETAPPLTYFELTALLAVALFEHAEVDVGIMEVGLGGRLDAVNAMEPDLTILTSIGFDHQAWLGETIPEITREKCGILRPSAPVVIGRQVHAEATETILEQVDGQVVRQYGRDFGIADDGEMRRVGASSIVNSQDWSGPRRWNAAAATEGARQLLGNDFDPVAAAEGLEGTMWPGRLDRRDLKIADVGPVDALLDAAHNHEATMALRKFLETAQIRVDGIVFGALADKEFGPELFSTDRVRPPIWGAIPDNDRSLGADELSDLLPPERLRAIGSIESVLPPAMRHVAESGGTLLIFGSSYLVGDVLAATGVDVRELSVYQAADSNSD